MKNLLVPGEDSHLVSKSLSHQINSTLYFFTRKVTRLLIATACWMASALVVRSASVPDWD